MTRSRGSERRRSKRRRRRLGVRFWNDEVEGSGFTRDISNTGLMIETTTPVDIGGRIHLELKLPDGEPYYAEGLVVRKKVYPRQAASLFKPGLGVKFVGMSEAIREVMRAQSHRPPSPLCDDTTRDPGELLVDLREPDELRRVYDCDIRHGGVQIETPNMPPVNEEVSVVLLLPDPNGSITCLGSIVAHVDEPPGVGVRLQDVDQIRGRLLEIIGDR